MGYWKLKAVTLVLFALLWLGASYAQVRAETVSYTDTIPLQTTNWSQQLQLPRFDPTLGILTEIDFALQGKVRGLARIENLDAAAATVIAESFATVRLQRPNGSFLSQVTPVASRSAALAAFDGEIDFQGASGTAIDQIDGLDISEQTILTTPTELAAYTGSGFMLLQVDTTGSSKASGAGNLALSFSTLASAAITITYHFEQPAITLKKATNGFDADLIPGPLLSPGTTVTWSYTIANTGNLPLQDLTLVDDQEGDITGSCPKHELAVGETIICTATGVARLGQYANTATVSGTVPAVLPGEPHHVHATDPSHYYGTALALCPTGAAGEVLMPNLLYLGEGPGTYTLPAGYQQLVVKKLSPLRFATLATSSYQAAPRTGAPERVWACAGHCVFTVGHRQVLAFGELPANVQLHMALLDDDTDERVNTLFADGNLEQPIVQIEPQRLTTTFSYTVPFAAVWSFYAADSIGVYICVQP